jgi:hypothetical protein
VPDDDLAELLAAQLLFLESALDLLDVEQAAVDQQRAEVLQGRWAASTPLVSSFGGET